MQIVLSDKKNFGSSSELSDWLESRGAWDYVCRGHLKEYGATEVFFDSILSHLKRVGGI